MIRDVDRLREAADRLDGNAGAPGISVKQMNTEAATAALLRAVAEDVKVWNGYMPDQPTNAKIHKRAFALADVILGERDD